MGVIVTMKNKKILLILGIFIIILIVGFQLFKMHKEYTGYQLILVANYEGGHFGKGKKKKIFNVSEKDKFYEPSSGGGVWSLNLNEDEVATNVPLPFQEYFEILEIEKFEENEVKIKSRDKFYNIKYNEEFYMTPGSDVSHGINYSYVIRIIKK